MKKYDMKIICAKGHLKLSDCTNLPTKESIDEYIENSYNFGLGNLKKIIIENIR